MFEEFKPNWYEVKLCEENDFLNQKLENDTYGIYYSVAFVGNAEAYLWQSKTAPVVGEKYYGHIEPSKSGKSMRFKKDKAPENEPVPQGANPKQASYVENPEKQASINRAVALNGAVACRGMKDAGTILSVAEEFFAWLQNDVPETEDTIDDLSKDIGLGDIDED